MSSSSEKPSLKDVGRNYSASLQQNTVKPVQRSFSTVTVLNPGGHPSPKNGLSADVLAEKQAASTPKTRSRGASLRKLMRKKSVKSESRSKSQGNVNNSSQVVPDRSSRSQSVIAPPPVPKRKISSLASSAPLKSSSLRTSGNLSLLGIIRNGDSSESNSERFSEDDYTMSPRGARTVSLSNTTEVKITDQETRRKAAEIQREKVMIMFRAQYHDFEDQGEDYEDQLFLVPDIPRVIVMSGDDHPYQIRSATINKIIERVTCYLPTFMDEYFEFLETFFMTYRSFITPMKCLKLLIRRFKESLEVNEEDRLFDWVSMSDVRKGVCNAIVTWFKEHYRDFSCNVNVKKVLDRFIKEAKELNTPENAFVLRMEKTVLDKQEVGSYKSFFSMVVDKNVCPAPIVPKTWKNVTFLDLNEEEIARQLTMEEFNLYAEIKPEELQDLAWSRPKLKARSPNLLQMIERFNHVSNSFATLIVDQDKLKNRKKVLEKLITIMEHLNNLQSFNMQMAIMSAFGMSSIHRLKHTFSAIKPKFLETAQKFQEMFSTKSSSKVYREIMSQVQPPCIPFLGVYLTDLTFIDEGNPDKVNNLVNFRKKQLEYDVIVQVLKFQKTQYQLHMFPQINNIIADLPELEEDPMYAKSIKIEPRGSKKKDLQ